LLPLRHAYASTLPAAAARDAVDAMLMERYAVAGLLFTAFDIFDVTPL